jgi:hypothetical protein
MEKITRRKFLKYTAGVTTIGAFAPLIGFDDFNWF